MISTNQVQIFTGLNGYTKPMLKRIDANLSPIKQIINGSSVASFHKQTDNLVNQVITQRAKKGLAIQNLIRQKDQHLTIEISNPAVLKQTRLLPAGIDPNVMFAVFGDYLTLTSLDTNPLGLIIHNPTIAQAMHQIFDHLWSLSTPV